METGADVLVENLIQQGIERIFVLPGAKIDRVLEALRQRSSEIEMVLVRNEQAGAHMAAGHGRRTGKAGVVLVTSGPGVTNLATSLITATSEGDPVIALGGAVSLGNRLKRTHQSMDNVSMMAPVTKMSVEIDSPAAIGEVLANAFRTAEFGRPGAVFVSIPMDVMSNAAPKNILCPVMPPLVGTANSTEIQKAAELINQAKCPVILCGMLASTQSAAEGLSQLLESHAFPVITTFQGTGVVPKHLAHLFVGRIGLIQNQPADALLNVADVIITVGYDVVEYDAGLWNKNTTGGHKIIHIDQVPSDLDNAYRPTVELIGSIGGTLQSLNPLLTAGNGKTLHGNAGAAIREMESVRATWKDNGHSSSPCHPMHLVHDVQLLVDELDNKIQIFCDMGSHHIWLIRYLQVHSPRQLVISNGQQTLGVSLPWAISAALDYQKGSEKDRKVMSFSGDGGFLFCAQELETAKRENLNLVHVVWDDTCFDMVRIQQEKKYDGHRCAVDLGKLDYIAFAKAFGVHGFHVTKSEDFLSTLKMALELDGPVLIAVDVNSTENNKLFADVHGDILH
jgi:acetolactate synthase-1/2/3 large subunit